MKRQCAELDYQWHRSYQSYYLDSKREPEMRVKLLFLGLLIAALPGTSMARPPQPRDNDTIEKEVRKVFDAWSTALTGGDKKTYLNTFWDSPRLVIRVADGEWRGL